MQKKDRRIQFATLAAFMLVFPTLANGGVPPRFYWKNLSGTNAVPVIYQTMSGNVNPLDPAQIVTPGVNFDSNIAIAGYAKLLPAFDGSIYYHLSTFFYLLRIELQAIFYKQVNEK